MQKIITGILFQLCISQFLYAQDAYLSFIDREQQEFFRNNGWELYYANDDFKFYDYLIYHENLVVASNQENSYIIHFLNESRLIERSKSIKTNKFLPGLPKLYIDNDNIAFAPMSNFECIVIPEKERIKRKNRLKNWMERKQGKFFRKYWHYKGFTFYSFTIVDRESGYQKVEIQYGTDKKNLKTLYVAQIKSNMLTYSYGADRIEVAFYDDQVLLVDNFDKKLLSFDLEGDIIFEKELSAFQNKDNSRYHGDAILRMDPKSNNLYLILDQDLYLFLPSENSFRKVELNVDFRLHKPRIYNDYIYALFSSGDNNGRAIYRKKLFK